MMEFTFGYYPPNKNPSILDLIKNFGAKSVNVENARIRGGEITFLLQGKTGKMNTSFSGGYTYMDPVILNYDPARDTTGTSGTNVLKYRFRHMARADVQTAYRKWSTGFSLRYNSFMESIDKSFETELFRDIFPTFHSGLYILPGIKEYRAKHNKGDIVFDHRISWQFSETVKIALVTNNVFNREYMTRPGDVQAPRTNIVQVSLKF
jgi:iron complex outermembrane receptor protein